MLINSCCVRSYCEACRGLKERPRAEPVVVATGQLAHRQLRGPLAVLGCRKELALGAVAMGWGYNMRWWDAINQLVGTNLGISPWPESPPDTAEPHAMPCCATHHGLAVAGACAAPAVHVTHVHVTQS